MPYAWLIALLSSPSPTSLDGQGLVVGQPAPPFVAADTAGRAYQLDALRGKTVVMAFFPGDFTPRCTAEVRAFREVLPTIENRDVVVFGISGDPLEVRRRFSSQERLNFPLLIDERHELAHKYGVETPNGRPNRTTIVIGPDGTINAIDRDVDKEFSTVNGEIVTRHVDNLALYLSDWRGGVGKAIPPLWLKGNKGTVSFGQDGKLGHVYWFADPDCPVTKSQSAVMAALSRDPRLDRVAFRLVLSRRGRAGIDADAFRDRLGVQGEVGVDLGANYARHFEATETGEVWVTNATETVVYRGAISLDGETDGKVLRSALYNLLTAHPIALPEWHAKTHGLPIQP